MDRLFKVPRAAAIKSLGEEYIITKEYAPPPSFSVSIVVLAHSSQEEQTTSLSSHSREEGLIGVRLTVGFT